jgi:hypothetical protein
MLERRKNCLFLNAYELPKILGHKVDSKYIDISFFFKKA